MKIRTTSIYLIAVGFFSILGQVVILRELNVAFYGIELIYILSFAFWLVGTAIGAAAGRRSYTPLDKSIHGLFLISAILLIVDTIFIRGIRNLFGGVQGGYLPFFKQIIGLIIALLPIGLLSGLLFQWSAKKFISENGTLAKAYAIESAGGVIGGLGSTLFLNFGINNFSVALICGVCFAFTVNYYSFSAKNRLMKYLSVIVSIGIIILFVFSDQINMLSTFWSYSNMIESVDTPYNRVTITSSEKQISIFEDGVLSYETQSTEAEELVQLSTLQTTEFNNILVLGGGFEGIISELLKLPVKKIDYVELNEDFIRILQKCLPAELRNSLNSKKVNIIYDDPRKFLKLQYSYDIILVGMPAPMSAQTNRFYTKEFFKQCANSLKEMGILAFKIQSSENIWTQQLTERNAGIYNAVKSSFGDVLVLPGVTTVFVASKSKLTTDTKLLIDRFNGRNLETRLVSPQYINYIFTNDRFSEVQKLISSRISNINSDLQPVCFSYTISIWLSKFFPDLAYSKNLLPTISKMRNSIPLYIIVILIFGMIIIIRRFVGVRRFTLVFIAGFIGMILEIILILLYQNKNGVLFRDIGLLLMVFMFGLFLGSLFVDRLFVIMKNRIRSEVWLGRLLFIGFSLLIFIVYLSVNYDLMSSLSIISLALFVNGTFVSGIFAFASLYQVTNQQVVVKRLYTADLIGGCLGSLLASLILIPIYGFFFSLILITILSVYCLIFVF
jgi:spermidine synthase